MTTRIRSRPSEKPQAGTLWPEEHADEVVVPPAAAEAAGQVGHGDLHDRARVVRQPARQARVERRCGPAHVAAPGRGSRARFARLPRTGSCDSADAQLRHRGRRRRRRPLRSRSRANCRSSSVARGLGATPRASQFAVDAVRARSCPACRARRAPSRAAPSGTPAASASTSASWR